MPHPLDYLAVCCIILAGNNPVLNKISGGLEMKAAFVVAPRKFEVRDIEMPKITDDEVLVKVAACGVCTSDMATYLDSFSPGVSARGPFPRRVGHEPSSTVVEVGKNVKEFKAGDRITGIFGGGSFAEYVSFNPAGGPGQGRQPMGGKIPQRNPLRAA